MADSRVYKGIIIGEKAGESTKPILLGFLCIAVYFNMICPKARKALFYSS